jgi:hypothetical protein
MNDRNLTVARDQDELEAPCQSGTMRIARIAPLRPVDRTGLVGDWSTEHDAIEPHRSAPTRPAPKPSEHDITANLLAQYLEATRRQGELAARLSERGITVDEGGL